MNWLDPFQYSFMNEALLVGALVGAVCAVLSCYLVLKGWSLMGDAISHAVLPGVVLAYIVGLPLAIGAFVFGLLCATATGWIKSNSRIKEDTVMGIVFTGLFALGLVMHSKVQSDLHLTHILFGNILGIERSALIQTAVTAVVSLFVTLLLRRDLLLFCFDPSHARAIGQNTTLTYYLFLALLSATIVASIQAVGIILVVAMLVTPGCTARLLTDRFDRMLLIAGGSSVSASCLGVYISFFIDGSTGACIVLTQALFFTLAFVFAPKHGLLAGRRGQRRFSAEPLPLSEGPEKTPVIQ
jgi:ABC-type Mn2+/Zn2+ transport system permease subunit